MENTISISIHSLTQLIQNDVMVDLLVDNRVEIFLYCFNGSISDMLKSEIDTFLAQNYTDLNYLVDSNMIMSTSLLDFTSLFGSDNHVDDDDAVVPTDVRSDDSVIRIIRIVRLDIQSNDLLALITRPYV